MNIFIRSKESIVCPICKGALKSPRHQAPEGHLHYKRSGEDLPAAPAPVHILRQASCRTPGLYAARQALRDRVRAEIDSSRENPATDESTLRRWRTGFHQGKDQIEGALRALWSESLVPRDSLLRYIKLFLVGYALSKRR